MQLNIPFHNFFPFVNLSMYIIYILILHESPMASVLYFFIFCNASIHYSLTNQFGGNEMAAIWQTTADPYIRVIDENGLELDH